MPHFSGEVSKINDSLTMLSDGCLCMSAFVFGAGFQADPIKALVTVGPYGRALTKTHKAQRAIERREAGKKAKCMFSDYTLK